MGMLVLIGKPGGLSALTESFLTQDGINPPGAAAG